MLHYFGPRRRAISLSLLLMIGLVNFGATASAYPDVTWTGDGADDNWATTKNWNPQSVPTSLDSVFFNDAGASKTAGVTTNFLAANQTVANLSYANDLNYHTTDLQGFQLNVAGTLQVNTNKNGGTQTTITQGTLQLGSELQPGNLYVARNLQPVDNAVFAALDLSGTTFNATLDSLIAGQKSVGMSGSGRAVVTGGHAGDIVVGSKAHPGTIYIGRTEISGEASGVVDFSDQDSLTATVGKLWLGTADGGSAVGTLYLAPDNHIDATSIRVGYSTQNENSNGTSVLRLGANNVINADELIIGGRRSNGSLDIAPGGTLQLGSESRQTSFAVGQNDLASPFEYSSSVNLQGSTFNAQLSRLTVSQKTAGSNGSSEASFFGGSQGNIVIGSSDQPGSLIVGSNTQGGSSLGQLDLGGQTSLTATLDQFQVGVAINGTARGSIILAQANVIHANTITIGQSSGADNYVQPSMLRLGMQNEIVAGQLLVGGRRSYGTLETPAGAVVNLGNAATPTSFVVGRNDSDSGTSPNQNATASFAGATFNAHLSELIVGEKSGGINGGTMAILSGGNNGAIVVGSSAAPGNIFVGHNVLGEYAVGVVDLSSQDSLTATVDQFLIGFAANGTARGTVSLPHTNTIDANTIVVGQSLNSDNYNGGSSLLRLGQLNNITTNQLLIGGRRSNGSLDIPAGGVLNLGTELKPTSLVVGRNDADTGGNQTASMNLSGAAFNAHLSELIVAEKTGGPNGSSNATFIGGNSGTIQIGSPTTRGNFVAGSTTAADTTQANVDLSGQDQLTAYLDRFEVAVSTQRRAGGQVKLAKSNDIDAKSLTVGNNSGGETKLTLGLTNNLLVDEFNVGMNYGIGIVQIPAGGVLNLGSAVRPTQLTIGSGKTNTNDVFWGNVDLTNATVHAHLGTVIIGQKDNLPGTQQGTLTISNHADNTIVADSIFLGGIRSEGRLTFGGGTLSVGSISKGDGTAIFNWQGGTLAVDNFGTPAKSFNLDNMNFGTLDAGYSSNVTNVFGQYNQGSLAALQIDEHAGLFDRLVVSQTAALKGTLDLNLTPGFSPALGETFTILNATSVTGVFNHVTGYYGGGNTFVYPVYHPTFVELKAYLAGDSNFDGKVDGADYTAWADSLFKPGDGVATGDFNGDGLVDGVDYVIWADHFTAVATLASLAAVPEPSSLLLAAIGVLGLTFFRLRTGCSKRRGLLNGR